MSEARSRLLAARLIVVKVGSALLVDGESGEIRSEWLDSLVRDIQGARAAGLFTVRVAAAGPRRTEGDADVITMLEEVPAAAGRLVKGSGAHAA